MGQVLLAFDTSTERVAVSLQANERIYLAEAAGGASASGTLLPLAEGLLHQARLEWASLNGLGFGEGPGAFTGLRTAASVAQGLAFGLGRLVWPLDTLAAVLEDAQWNRDEVPHEACAWVLTDARMGEVYAAAYQWQSGCWKRVSEPRLRAVSALSKEGPGAPEPPWLVAGSALRLPELQDCGWVASTPRVAPSAWPSPRALARVMSEQFAAGGGVPPEQAVPVYVRDKVALTTTEREQRAVSC